MLNDLLHVSGVLSNLTGSNPASWHSWLLLFPSYIARVAMVYEIDMKEILEYNINKLESRKARGTLTGSGDVR